MKEKNKGKPKVSVIIPTYNRAHLIGQAIKSILNQTYQNFEIIVVDDGSTDNTEEVVKNLRDERIKYIKHEKNKGASAARNTGIKVAGGKYIAFQDSDDEWFPKKLEKQIKAFENAPQNIGVIYTGLFRIENNKKEYIPYSWVKKKEGNISKEILKGNFVATPTLLVRKECIEKVGMFDECLQRLQDWELVIRISKYYYFKFINEPLLISRYNSDSITANKDARIQALKHILLKHQEDFIENKELLSKYYFEIGGYLCLNNEIAEGDSYLAKAFEIYQNKKLLSENYFIVGRRLCSKGNIKNGRNYLIKAIKTYPLNFKILIVTLFSFFGQNVYKKFLILYKKLA